MRTASCWCVVAAAACAALGVEDEHFYRLRALRGYGEVSAVSTAGDGFSRLDVRCEDAAKAGILHAKYLSDLHVLEGVSDEERTLGGVSVPVVVVPSQGLVSAYRVGRRVTVVAAAGEQPWSNGLASVAGDLREAEMVPRATVPMYLDAWDRHGFRFYYRPWETPKRGQAWGGYPVLDEFDFARRENGRGFVFWAEAANVDNAVGLDGDLWWDWAARAAERRGLPAVINTMNVEPTWLLNGWRGQGMSLMPQFCGAYHGVANQGFGGMRSVSWCAEEAQEAQLEAVRRIVGRYAVKTNTLEYLEPHGELRHGDYDALLEYGPSADESFRAFLKEKYGGVSRVAARWGRAGSIRRWSEVRVPDLAALLGHGKDAVDLTGVWRIGYEPLPTSLAAASEPGFGDSLWPALEAPGNDRAMFLDKRPAVFRRAFEVPSDWLSGADRAWLYVWDLNAGAHLKERIAVALNGCSAGEDLTKHATSHWAAFDVRGALRAGTNTVAIRVPQGFLGYRVYLSKRPPLQYPDLPDGDRALWVDFADWRQSSRIASAERGLRAIRGVDPDRSIICMAPGAYVSGMKKLCERYGARFHDTGGMGAFWNEYLPMVMRGADLPFSLEPGGPAEDLPGFKRMMGYYLTEGVQAIHYFIHVGSIFWPADIRAHFEKIRPLIDTVGKVHPPKAEIAMLFSDRIDSLTGFPWGADPNVNLPSGAYVWPLNAEFTGEYDFDGVTDLDFADGTADPYRVVVAANTSVMDEKLVRGIESWVRRGGIFVAFAQAGRHAPEKKDAWPISRLSGYEVRAVSRVQATAQDPYEVADWWGFSFATNQAVFRAEAWDLKDVKANGLKMRAVAPECEDLARWEDGSAAIGLRPLGKGYVVHVGLKFCRVPLWHGWPDRNAKLFRQLFEWARVRRVPATAEGVTFRRYVSNNGLFDTWTLFNEKKDRAVETDLAFRDGLSPAFCREVGTSAVPALSVGRDGLPAVRGLRLEPLETRIFVTPKGHLAEAPAQWFELQRNWWRGAADVPHAEAKSLSGKAASAETGQQAALDLTDGWRYKVLGEGTAEDASPLAAAGVDDAAWPKRRLDCWAVPEELPSHRVLFWRTVAVPAAWRDGSVELWLRSWFAWTVAGKARYWVDGVEATVGDGHDGLSMPVAWAPGSTHTLAVEVRGEGQVCGVRGNTWLAFTKRPACVLDLAGEWSVARDWLGASSPASLPGTYSGKLLGRQVEVPRSWGGKQIYLRVEADRNVTGCLVNGRYVRRHHHALGETTFLNITPWVAAGGTNRLEVVGGGDGAKLRGAALWQY